MKKFQKSIIIAAMASTAFIQVGWFGTFKLTNSLYNWNKGLGDKWVNSLVMWGLFIIPVYGVTVLIDFAILNLVEFWGGKNPVSMNAGEKEIQIVEKNGNTYRMEATQNQFMITQLTGKKKGHVETLVYNPKDLSWTANTEGKSQLVSRIEIGSNGETTARIFNANGKSISIAAPVDETSLAASLQNIKAYRLTAAH